MIDQTNCSVFYKFTLSLFALISSMSFSAYGAEAGAWETFSSQANVDAWSVYDYSDELDYFPEWNDSVLDEEDVYFYHTGDNALWFHTGVDGSAGGGRLIGDFASENIQAISCDIEIDSLEDFYSVDCAILATGSAGRRYYYSSNFYADEFDGAGWWALPFAFDDQWYYYEDGYIAVDVTPELLASIEEVGFRFFPKTGTTTEVYAAIDNVKLVPKVDPTDVTISRTSDDFQMLFTPGNGIACVIEKMGGASPLEWYVVAGQEEVIGASEHLFSTPLLGGVGLFRVKSTDYYTPFITTAP